MSDTTREMTIATYLDQLEAADQSACAHELAAAAVDSETSRRSKNSPAVIFMLLIAVAAVYLTSLRSGPQQASAAFDASNVTLANRTAVATFLTAAPANVKWMEKTLASTEKVVENVTTIPAVKQVPLAALKTNPFRGTTVAIAAPADQSAARLRMENQRESALRAVESLQLQSVLVSDKNRSCLINNGLYVEGQAIDQFVIERIAPGSVIVRSGLYRFELKTR